MPFLLVVLQQIDNLNKISTSSWRFVAKCDRTLERFYILWYIDICVSVLILNQMKEH